jgi:hypothetical protein
MPTVLRPALSALWVLAGLLGLGHGVEEAEPVEAAGDALDVLGPVVAAGADAAAQRERSDLGDRDGGRIASSASLIGSGGVGRLAAFSASMFSFASRHLAKRASIAAASRS